LIFSAAPECRAKTGDFQSKPEFRLMLIKYI
jgi:hypothetical protein